MTRLETWWTRAARRAERAVRLEDALLGGRFAAYAVHRLRYLGARTLVGTVELVLQMAVSVIEVHCHQSLVPRHCHQSPISNP